MIKESFKLPQGDRAIISLHVGGAGLSMGHEIWRLMAYNRGMHKKEIQNPFLYQKELKNSNVYEQYLVLYLLIKTKIN